MPHQNSQLFFLLHLASFPTLYKDREYNKLKPLDKLNNNNYVIPYFGEKILIHLQSRDERTTDSNPQKYNSRILIKIQNSRLQC